MSDALPPPGYRMAILPSAVRTMALAAPWTDQLLVTDIGYFPRANGHRRERPRGCPELVVMACVNGRGWCTIAGKESAVDPGTVVILPPQQAHAYGADAQDPWSIWWLHLAGIQVQTVTEPGGWLEGGVFVLPDIRALVRLIGRALAALEHGTDPRRLKATTTIGWMILGSLQELAVHVDGTVEDPAVAKAIRTMHEHLERPFTVAGLARLAGCSSSHFAARFKAATGHGAIDYLLRLRMERAAWLLDNGSEGIETIARHLGYDDPAYFSRRFSLHHGCSPREYRQR